MGHAPIDLSSSAARLAVILAFIVVCAYAGAALIWTHFHPAPLVPDTHECTAGCLHVGPDVLVFPIIPLRGEPKPVAPQSIEQQWSEFVDSHDFPSLWAEVFETTARTRSGDTV